MGAEDHPWLLAGESLLSCLVFPRSIYSISRSVLVPIVPKWQALLYQRDQMKVSY